MKNNWSYSDKVKKLEFTESHQHQVLERLNTLNRKKSSRKILVTGVTIATVVAMLALSTIFSPAMVNVLAKIPYISQFVKDEEHKMEQFNQILQQINMIVKKNNLNLSDININHEDKSVIIYLDELPKSTEDFAEKVHTQLENGGFKGYEVEVVAHKERNHQSEQTQQEIEQAIQKDRNLSKELTKRLHDEEYELMFPVNVSITPERVGVTVIVPESEERLDQLKELMEDVAKGFGETYELDIRQVEKIAREQEKRWGKTGAIGHIGQALMESDEFPVTGYAYSFHPYPLEIIMKTSLDQNDSDAEKVAQNIRNEIHLYIQNDEETSTIRNDAYEVKVLSKDRKEIQ
ncbi:DUF4030 domain-containing protein [Pseudalkalibacillus hwajinpoensis]|uniref:DUF4030 domain-containing protein n=1 Tax=Guptibacillus hwajinpoensis TaxID=208199 RepID=A0A4U1MNT7_9BACL|nr:DUF4030 domain-containing protein [Pseudalkalibacillus hwajinpoensis]TKD72312.1 DUF4030 domain-containing protein [Pseudalkalibacillus hwajinpoensis]